MKPCPRCSTSNADTNRFCQQCGRQFEIQLAETSSDPTVFWGREKPVQAPVSDVLPVASLFAEKTRLVVGRATDCDICLPHPMVSRYHALLEQLPEGHRLRDLASVNGVLVNGRRITDSAWLREGERFGIGPFLFTFQQGALHTLDSQLSLRLEAQGLEKVVLLRNGSKRKILEDINLVVQPGEFVSLLGPSGSGKSTLMDCLNGRRRATGGRVLANGENFYTHFDNFRQLLGYVPQKDIVHTQLTVYRALYYTARLRLPGDTDPVERNARLEEVLREMELGPHRDTLVGHLSGGQVKRVSLGAELLAQPCLLYIDEATSGLDAGTEARMMRLFRRLANEGRSIICITHNVDNVDQCHLALILARGKVVYYGPPGEAPEYFGVKRISEIYDRIGEREPEQWVRDFHASSHYQEYVADRLAASTEDFTSTSRSGSSPSHLSTLLAEGRKLVSLSQGPPLAERFRELKGRLPVKEWFAPVFNCWHQFRILTARYLELLLGDKRGLRLLLLQAPVVALFLLVGFIGKPFDDRVSPFDFFIKPDGEPTAEAKAVLDNLRAEVQLGGQQRTVTGPQLLLLYEQLRERREALNRLGNLNEVVKVKLGDDEIPLKPEEWEQLREGFAYPNPRYTYMLLFLLAMIVMWFGCNNAAKEIVKEEAVYARERAVNLGILPYLASKFLVLSAITALHAVILLGMIYGILELLAYWVPGYTVPLAEHRLSYLGQVGVLVLLGTVGVALGLLLSACVTSPDRANALLPYVLIPQIILGGGVLNVHQGVLHYLAVTLSPVYWAYRAIHLGAQNLPKGHPGHTGHADALVWPVVALVIQMAVLLLMTAWFLRQKEAGASR